MQRNHTTEGTMMGAYRIAVNAGDRTMYPIGDYVVVHDEAAHAKAMSLARGCYQRALLSGDQNLSGSSLRGRARDYKARYCDSRDALLDRMTDAGIAWAVLRDPKNRHILALGEWYCPRCGTIQGPDVAPLGSIDGHCHACQRQLDAHASLARYWAEAGDGHISLRAIDVGFDLRLHPEIATMLHIGLECIDVDGPTAEDPPVRLRGTRAELAAQLRAYGYACTLEWECPRCGHTIGPDVPPQPRAEDGICEDCWGDVQHDCGSSLG